MLILEDLTKLHEEEKRRLLVILRSFTYKNMLTLQKEKIEGKSKTAVVKILKKSTVLLKKDLKNGLDDRLSSIDLNYKEINNIIEMENKRVSGWSSDRVEKEIIRELANLSSFKGNPQNTSELARRIMVEAAKGYKIKVEGYGPGELEDRIFRSFIDILSKQLEKELNRSSPERLREIKEKLRQELDKLSASDKELIRQELDLDELSAGILLDLFKKQGAAMLSLYAANSLGFGLYLSVTTMVHAVFTTIMGVTLPFAVYTTLTSLIALVLSPLGWILITGGVGGALLKKSSVAFNRRLLALAIVILRSGRVGRIT